MRALVTLLVVAAAALMPATALGAFGDHALRRGSHGHAVRVLQSWLTRLHAPTPVDGVYGRRTTRSVRRFERRRDLAVDGRVSRREGALLRRLIEGAPIVSAPAAPRSVPAATTGVAVLGLDGRSAIAPPDAPPAVVAAIAAANALTHKPYVWGGGHGRWEDRGYDCSGAVSYVLHAAGVLDQTLDSSGLARWGDAGPGAWITVYGNATHAYVLVAGLRFDTAGAGESGPRWRVDEPWGSGYAVRHPDGL